MKANFKPGKTKLPKLVRLGMQMTLPTGFEQITWLGPGPQESYCDRKDRKVGPLHGTVDEQFYAALHRARRDRQQSRCALARR